ncbi:MAG: DPP IV N-terminal domain-containing protein [Anaerolineae bacterium]
MQASHPHKEDTPIRRWYAFKVAGIGLMIALAWPLPAHSTARASEGLSRLAFAAYRHSQWDLYSVDEAGGDLRQLTDDSYEDRDPAYSPDGTKLAFASRRDRNWDLYILDLVTGQQTRLTDHPAYDGAPAWNPDGTQVAFESFRAGDLRPYLGHVTAPTLVAWGCHDLLLPHDSFETLVDLLPAARGHCFTNIGHNPHLTRAPRFTKLILTFLGQVKGDNESSGTTPTDTRQLWTPFTVTAPTDH